MNVAEDFKNKLEDLRNKREQLLIESKQLENNYISKNSEFEIGEKVKLIQQGREDVLGFVSKRNVDTNGKISYKLVKMKKDGTPSQHELWTWYNSVITKL